MTASASGRSSRDKRDCPKIPLRNPFRFTNRPFLPFPWPGLCPLRRQNGRIYFLLLSDLGFSFRCRSASTLRIFLAAVIITS